MIMHFLIFAAAMTPGPDNVIDTAPAPVNTGGMAFIGANTRLEERQRALRYIERVCEGRSTASQRECDRVWGVIRDGYATLQKQRAEAAASAAKPKPE